MSKPKHTPGPWLLDGWVENASGEREYFILRKVKEAGLDDDLATTRSPANAARIVACVNAMEGIDDPAAARALLDDPRMTMATEVVAGLRQAVEQLDADNRMTSLDGRGALIRKLEALLIKCEGGKK